MEARFLFVFSLLLSVGVWANSTVFVLEDNTAIRSSKSEENSNNILKVINKDHQLQRLTMHYSGWSLVEVDNINGWIPSAVLTDVAPNKLEKITNNNDLLKEELDHHKKKTKDLSDKLLKAEQKLKDLQLSYEKSTNTITKLTTDLEALMLENKHLINTKSEVNKVKISQEKKVKQNPKPVKKTPAIVNNEANLTTTPFNINWVYYGTAGVFGVIVLLILSIYNRNKRRHFDLNTLRR
ncbi:MAG: hypothetical protein K0U08_03165 [Proteobacteria bacterium]|nr:hypothetical protein [Pseudomonadota bacterium]MCH9711485.1 hypothetical protein [Pseudomonadota bacterium]MCH9749215.1 hypothetical protein [Pseudomonadota bacterium]